MRKIFNIILIMVSIVAIVVISYFTISKTIEYKTLLYDSEWPVSAYKDRLEVVKTFVGGTEVFPEFYMNVKNNSDDKEVIYIKALFRVYDWETDYLKAEGKPVLLDCEQDKLTIKPGETKTVKVRLFDLRYKKDDIIKYKFIDVKVRKCVK